MFFFSSRVPVASHSSAAAPSRQVLYVFGIAFKQICDGCWALF